MRAVLTFFVFILLSLPSFSQAAPLVPVQCDNPNSCGTCEFVSVFNNVIQFIVQISSLLAVIVFIYAGFLMVTSQGNEGQLSKAKGLFTNVVIGLVILLAAFLIVNVVLQGFLKTGSPVYQWQTIECVYPAAPVGYLDTSNFDNSMEYNTIGAGMPGVTGGYSGPLSQCYDGNTACSVGALLAAGFSAEQANVMSCIAMTESSGIAATGPYNERHPGSNSSACGTFQVVRTTWNQYASGACSDFSQCTNASCNMQVAQSLVSSNGYSDWTCPNCNNKAQGCIDKYSN